MNQQYAPYGYYSQPMYPPHGPPHGPPMIPPQGYQPFYQPHPSQQLPPGPVPVSYDPEAYSQDYHKPQHSKSKRRQSAPSAPPQPLKPALRKTLQNAPTPMVNALEFPQANPYANNAPSGYPLSRTRTNSINHPSNEGRRRAHSNAAYDTGIDPPFLPMHMFISFHGYNELRLENITDYALKELREEIWPIWEDGVEVQAVNPTEWVVKFRNQPWDMSGPNYLVCVAFPSLLAAGTVGCKIHMHEALKLIVQLFTLCARRGYVFQTAINIGQQAPRLVFNVVTPDFQSSFFLAYFSSNGRRLTLVNPPSHIDLSLGAQLKVALPRKITTDHVENSNLRIIEIKRKPNYSAPEVEYGLFLAHVLKILNTLGFDLDASIPLAKRQSLGPRSSQEIMVFKGSLPG